MYIRILKTGFCCAVLFAWKPSCIEAAPIPLDFNAKEYINGSYNFLLNREPEMTETEFALYEEVLPMVFDQPEVAITLLETMLADDDPESPAFSYVLIALLLCVKALK